MICRYSDCIGISTDADYMQITCPLCRASLGLEPLSEEEIRLAIRYEINTLLCIQISDSLYDKIIFEYNANNVLDK